MVVGWVLLTDKTVDNPGKNMYITAWLRESGGVW